jgi:hypothetical protein
MHQKDVKYPGPFSEKMSPDWAMAQKDTNAPQAVTMLPTQSQDYREFAILSRVLVATLPSAKNNERKMKHRFGVHSVPLPYSAQTIYGMKGE